MAYVYAYTRVTWNGFQRANFTALQPQWLKATKISMLGSCAANKTCADVYDAFTDPAADAALDAYILTAIKDIASALPDGGNKTWIPYDSNANAFSTLTTMATMGGEVFGIHNGFALSAKGNPNVTESQLETAFDLAIYLSGGASMIESILKRIAFRFYDTYRSDQLAGYTPTASAKALSTSSKGSTSTKPSSKTSSASLTSSKASTSFITTLKSSSTSSSTRSSGSISRATTRSSSTISSSLKSTSSSSRINTSQTTKAQSTGSTKSSSKSSSSQATTSIIKRTSIPREDSPNRKITDLKKMAVLRGADREAIKSLKMENYADLITTVPMMDLHLSDDILGNASSLNKRDCPAINQIDDFQAALTTTSIMCSANSIRNAVVSLVQASKMTGLLTDEEIMLAAGRTTLDIMSVETSAVSILCNMGLPCYPGSALWQVNKVGNILSIVGLAASIASGAEEGAIALNIACITVGYALNAYKDAKACCVKDCGAPSCMAAAIACSYPGLSC